jgi:hypothetical protein
MTRSLLIYNERSGSYDPALIAQIDALFADAGRPIGRRLALGDEELPDAASARADELDLIVTLSGDGSMSAVADRLAGWDGTLLVLPGGTMNLLSRALHGERMPPQIVEAYLGGEGAELHVPIIRAGSLIAYTGMILGPTAAWGDVREDLRNLDVAALASNVPRALSATLNEPGVALEGRDIDYPAIFVEPSLAGIRAYGVLAGSAGELFGHGWAWLTGDFRNGPSESLGTAPVMRFRSAGARLDILVDGEKETAASPIEIGADQSDILFYAAQGEVGWR